MSRAARKLLCLAMSSALVVGLVQVVSIVTAPDTATALASPVTGSGGQFVPVQGRILDTRAASQVGPYGTAMPAGTWRPVPVQGVAGIPSSGVSAVAVTLTVLNPASAGLLHADKNGATPNSTVTYMNYAAGVQESNTATLAVAGDGKIQVVSTSATNMLIDVQGYYTADDTVAPGGYVPVTPKRLVDTGTGTGLPKNTLAGGSTTTVQVTSPSGIPSGATGVMLNLTVAHNTATGSRFFTPYPADQARPSASMNFSGAINATGAQVGLSTTGTPTGAFKFFLSGSGYTIDLIVDVVGYFAPGTSTGAYTPAIARVWDSRTTGHSTLASGTSITVPVAGVNGIPQPGSGISSVTTNLAVISGGTRAGYLSMFASGTSRPSPFSTINYQPSVYTSNMATSALGANGAVTVFNSGPDAVNFVIDLEGWYTNVGNAITNGQTDTQQSVTLQASPNGGGAWVKYQYRTGTTGDFIAVPTANLTDKDGNAPGGTTSQKSNGSFPAFTWNIRDTLAVGNLPAPDSLVQVQACYGTSNSDSNPACGMPTSVTFSQTDDGQATTDIGPGSVSELTGDFQLSETDADVTTSLGGLSVGRTLNTLRPAAATGAAGVFGPGWTASLTDGDAGAGGLSVTRDGSDGTIMFAGSDGTVSVYQTNDSPTAYPVSYTGTGDNAGDGVAVTKTNASTITLAEGDTTTTTWSKSGTTWSVATVRQPGSNSTTTYTYNSSGLPTRALAPVPDGVTCTTPDTTPGCRSLVLNYAGAGTATRLTSVGQSIPQTSGVANTITVASYDYDSSGRLAHTWDPRITPALKTTYGYDSSNRLTSLTPPGLATWSLAYDSPKNRLSTVSRPDPSGSTATTTVVYDVPISTNNNSVRPDLSSTATGTWGQTDDRPVLGTAVFDPDHVPSASVSAADWPYASIDYYDVNGRTVNNATYGAGDWQISTTQYDSNGNEIWSLTPGNRAQTLTTTVDTDSYVAGKGNVDRAALLASTTTYDPLNPGRVTDTFGPTHPVTLTDGTVVHARTHTATVYDEGAPNGGVNPATNQSYGLSTSVINTVWRPDTGADTAWPDIHITRIGYDPITNAAAPNVSGWDLGRGTTSTVQMGRDATASDLVTAMRYDSNGRMLEQRLPNDNDGTTPRTTLTRYITANGSGPCVDPAHTGMACSTGPGGQPGSGAALPVLTYSYDQYGNIAKKTETFGAGEGQTLRVTTLSYDAAERPTVSALSVAPAAGGGSPLPAITRAYSSITGLPTTVSTTTNGSTKTLTTGYDVTGRTISYVDSTGITSTTSYSLAGSITARNNSKRSITYTTDKSDEHRGVVTSEDIAVTGGPSTFDASYDPAGNLNKLTFPNGLAATRHYDNAGNLTSLDYSRDGSTWMTFTQDVNAIGQVTRQSSPQSAQRFSYDPASRLTTVHDTYQNTCTTRSYSFDSHSNRTELKTYPGANGSNCATTSAPGTSSYTYDDADRLVSDSAGTYEYDVLSRTTKVPAGDSNNIGSRATVTGDLTVGYFANDMVASQRQGNSETLFNLDPLQNRILDQTENGATSVNHYSEDSDSPSWTASGTAQSNWTEYVTDPSGVLGATVDQTGKATYVLTNLHGDIVATSSSAATTGGPQNYGESTEYGIPRTATTARDDYGWLGGKQRSTAALGGITLMGVRLYSASTGRFLSVDPVPGGNDNRYTYPLNPVSQYDLTGQARFSCGRITCTFLLGYGDTKRLLLLGIGIAAVGGVFKEIVKIPYAGIVFGAIAAWVGLIYLSWTQHRLVKFKMLKRPPFIAWPVIYKPSKHWKWVLKL